MDVIRTCGVQHTISQLTPPIFQHPHKRRLNQNSSHHIFLDSSNAESNGRGSLWHEFETDLPAADVWEVYGSLALGQLVPQLLPHVLSKVELVEGDGGVGTVLLVTFPPAGASEPRSYKEKFSVVNDEKYIKEAETVEGGFLDLGFQKYLVRFEVVGKEDGTSVIRSTVEYEVDAEHAKNVSLVSTEAMASIAEVITKYIKEQKKSPEQVNE